MPSFVQPAFFLILALSILVIVHEWGHFFVARRLGVRVLKFSVGFGPELVGVTRGDTSWSISAIPFGGYVKFAGDSAEEGQEGQEGQERQEGLPDEFLGQSLPVRAAIVLAGPVMNYVLAFALFSGVMFFAGQAVAPESRIGEVVEDSVAAEIGLRPGDSIREVNGVAVATWDEFTGELRTIGSDEPFTFAVDRDEDRVEIGGSSAEGFDQGGLLGVVYHRDPVLGYVQRGGAAWNAGLRTGDRIVTVEGEGLDGWFPFLELVRERPDGEIRVSFDRDGDVLDAVIVPEAREIPGEGDEVRTVGHIAAEPRVETRPVGLGEAISGGWDETWGLTTQVVSFLPKIPVLVFNGLSRMVTGQEPGDEGLGGPVRMAQMFGEAARWGLAMFIYLMANISAQLAIFNLLPVPVLDGGHLALYTVEAVTRKPPSIRMQVALQQVGFALLILLMLSVTVMDLGRALG